MVQEQGISTSAQLNMQEIFDLIIATASGRRTRGEEFGFGEDEFQPWHVGAVM